MSLLTPTQLIGTKGTVKANVADIVERDARYARDVPDVLVKLHISDLVRAVA